MENDEQFVKEFLDDFLNEPSIIDDLNKMFASDPEVLDAN